MTDSPNSTILSRRNALSAAGAAIALAPFASKPVDAAATAQTDEWLALFEAFIAAEKVHSDAFNELDEVKLTARKLHPNPRFKFSQVSYGWGRGKPLGWNWFDGISPAAEVSLRAHRVNRATIENYYDEHLFHGLSDKKSAEDEQAFRRDGECRKAESLADFDKWDAECHAVDQEHGVPELKALEAKALFSLNAAEDLIRAKSIDSFAAIAVNLALWARYVDGDASEEPLIGVFRAASKLAGIPEFFEIHAPQWAKDNPAVAGSEVKS